MSGEEEKSDEELFRLSIKFIESGGLAGADLSNEDKLELYGYYKQAEDGPCNTPKPSAFKVVDSAKWKAWKKMNNMPKEEARRRYLGREKEMRGGCVVLMSCFVQKSWKL